MPLLPALRIVLRAMTRPRESSAWIAPPRARGAVDRALERFGVVFGAVEAHAEVNGVHTQPGDRNSARRDRSRDGFSRSERAGCGGGSDEMTAVDCHGAPPGRNASFKMPATAAVPRRDSVSRLTALRSEQRQQYGLSGAP